MKIVTKNQIAVMEAIHYGKSLDGKGRTVASLIRKYFARRDYETGAVSLTETGRSVMARYQYRQARIRQGEINKHNAHG